MTDIKEENYWKEFYKNKHIITPTKFAIFVGNYLKENFPKYISMIELGCGNGRDTYYFDKLGFNVVGIDSAYKPRIKKNIMFKQMDLNDLFLMNNNFDVVYSRFFLHSINNIEIFKLVNWTKKLFVAEFRAAEDTPLLFKNHYRNKIDEYKFLNILLSKNYEILYYIKAKNLAKFKKENPIIIRIIARSKG